MKNIKKYLVILLFFLVLWIAYLTFINWKCRIIIKDNVFIGIKSGITEKKEDLKVVEIPDGVNEIGIFAFTDCVNLEKVKLSDDIKEIGMGAFYDCQNLKEIKLPEKLEIIRNGAFLKCKSLTEIGIPSDVRVIEEGAFSECSSLTNVQLPNTITEIKEKTFSNCINLKSVYLPNSLKIVGDSAFYNCSSLSSIRMSEGIESVGENAFWGTEFFKSGIADEYGSVYLGKVLLYNKGLNETVIVKDSTKVIANAVFINKSGLREIELPEGIIEIGDNCFENC
ncbi:MAG: leucine-rich repeat domain-containing protein, partial [Lachnospiraceae bacterium]